MGKFTPLPDSLFEEMSVSIPICHSVNSASRKVDETENNNIPMMRNNNQLSLFPVYSAMVKFWR